MLFLRKEKLTTICLKNHRLLILKIPIILGFLTILHTEVIGQRIEKSTRDHAVTVELEMENGGMLTQASARSTTYEGAYYNGLNVRVGWRGTGKKDQYRQIYNYPTYGIGFYSSTFDSDIIGNPYALYGFIQTSIAPRDNKRWTYDYRIGLGLSGNFNPYHEEENPLNLVIGSRTNVFIDLGIRIQYTFHAKWRAGLGLSFHHFSNGALALPNKGINLIPLSISVHYQPHRFEPFQRDTLAPYSHKVICDMSFGMGLKQMEKNSKNRYVKTTLGVYASKHLSYKWRMGGGYDLFYSSSGRYEEVAGDVSGKVSSVLSGGPSFYLVHVLNEKLLLNGNIGYYLHSQRFNGEIKKIFLRAGARYYVYQGLNFGVSIKAHMGKADFIEWTIGYSFLTKK